VKSTPPLGSVSTGALSCVVVKAIKSITSFLRDYSIYTVAETLPKQLEDISFNRAFTLILETFTNFMYDFMCLSTYAAEAAVERFIAFLPSGIKARLVAVRNLNQY